MNALNPRTVLMSGISDLAEEQELCRPKWGKK